ncbi:hypothetical protein [uncultured Gordonia sp.]|mgnify:CR=1 FL=1|uniref:hypothetical protein n=1 Tax=uncultured Gordonia sp. TaxID=198437 RepID=UPI00263852B2|nr:hypothetical protein [uncultured Gordonia sp.]
MEVPGMVGAPSMGERLDASRNRPLCDRCTQPATVKFEHIVAHRAWSVAYTCDQHFDEVLGDIDNLQYTKWLE